IVLDALGPDDVSRLVADALRCDPERSLSLAQLVHEKTGGNPFFMIQFLMVLADQGLIAYDPEAPARTWDLQRITSAGYTDNVVELMVGKLTRLPEPTRETLTHLACLGHSTRIANLPRVLEVSEEEAETRVREAERAGLIVRAEGVYAFLHDRVQEAAYALIPEDERPALHLRSGRPLIAGTPPDHGDQTAFEIVNQLNGGAVLMDSPAERVEVAELNLVAARRAKTAAAYASALTYLTAGEALLAEEPWEGQ